MTITPKRERSPQARPVIVGFEPISSDSDDDGIEQADDDESEQEEQGSQEGTADPDLPKGWIKVILLDGVLCVKRSEFLDLPLSLRSKMVGSGARRSLDEVKETLLAILLWRREGKLPSYREGREELCKKARRLGLNVLLHRLQNAPNWCRGSLKMSDLQTLNESLVTDLLKHSIPHKDGIANHALLTAFSDIVYEIEEHVQAGALYPFRLVWKGLWPAAPGLWRIIASECNTYLQIANEPCPPNLASELIFQSHRGGQEVKVTFGAVMAAIQYRLLRNNVLLEKIQLFSISEEIFMFARGCGQLQ